MSALEFRTVNDSDAEQQTIQLMQALNSVHDLSPWAFTDEVQVEAGVIPHSHPVLTLNTRHNQQVDLLLATYIHEQLHWFMGQHEQGLAAAIAELRERYPEVPVRGGEGGRDEYSTYLHLLVCWLEIDGISRLLSEQRVAAVLEYWQDDHYRWIYRKVAQDDEFIGELVRRHGLQVP